MKRVDIKIGYTCNNNCLHCVIADQRNNALKVKGRVDRTTSEYKKELLDSRKRGFEECVITGGEPTLRKDIADICRYASELGYLIQMQTNGRMLSNYDFAKILSKFNINYVVALHGPNAAIHDKITQSKGSFKQTVSAIKNLRKLKQEVYGKVVISKLNYKQLDELLLLFKKLDVKEINFAFPHALGNAWTNFDSVVPTYTEIKPYVHKLIELSKKILMNIDFEAMPLCFMVGYEDYVSENYMPEKTELKQFGYKKHDWNKARLSIKSKFSQCKKCRYDDICEGPWKEYAERIGDEEFRPTNKNQVIIKRYKTKRDILNTKKYIHNLNNKGIITQKILKQKNNSAYFNYIKGVSADKILKNNKDCEPLVIKLIQFIGTIHNTQIVSDLDFKKLIQDFKEKYFYFLEDLENKKIFSTNDATKIKEILIKEAPRELNFDLIHYDLSPNNIIICGNKLGLIDFECVSIAPKEIEVLKYFFEYPALFEKYYPVQNKYTRQIYDNINNNKKFFLLT